MTHHTNELYARISQLRKDCREHFGGIIFTDITKQFGVYKMNIPDNEAFIRYTDHHFVELEKMFSALIDSTSETND